MKLVLRNCLSSSFDEARREEDRRIKRYSTKNIKNTI